VLVASDGAVLPEVLKRLESCPECSPEHREAISRCPARGGAGLAPGSGHHQLGF
jgi:hypothetical protein